MATWTQKRQIEWLLGQWDYSVMAATRLGEYDDDKKYVGAEGDWKSFLVPRTIYKIDVNVCAYIHDYRYIIGGDSVDRKEADNEFYESIAYWISQYSGFIIGTLARIRAWFYYRAVRKYGGATFNYTEGVK